MHLRDLGRRVAAWVGRGLPDSLFGRLALLLSVAVVTSHVLALTVMIEWGGPPNESELQNVGQLSQGIPAAVPASQFRELEGHLNWPALGLILDIVVRLTALLLATWVGARWLSEPIRRLADAARELGHNIHRAPLEEDGTRECREATRVFNQMQQHIRAQLEQRDQFVAAVSHDLRTPLTRLALRVESLHDAAERQRFGKDIAEMNDMIRATLDYLMGTAEAEPWVMIDLTSLVESLVHDQQECGHDVSLVSTPTPPLKPVRARISALKRCIANLLENAVRYGGAAQVLLSADAHCVRVTVLDAGPGIPEAEVDKVQLPFYRVEASRNRHTGGVGLGLASASDIARQHGGTVVLSNRPGRGLKAEVLLPLQPT